MKSVAFAWDDQSLSVSQKNMVNAGVTAFMGDMVQSLCDLEGNAGPEFAECLAAIFEGIDGGRVVVARPSQRGRGRPALGVSEDKRRIALFMAIRAGKRPYISKMLVFDAIDRFGISRASVFRIWRDHRESTTSLACALRRSGGKGFRRRRIPRKRMDLSFGFDDP
jgi:hypothetical protein